MNYFVFYIPKSTYLHEYPVSVNVISLGVLIVSLV